MSFEVEKKGFLSRKDHSKKGSIDREIVPLINYINSLPNYYTTSSCAGRIVLLNIPKSGKKNEAEWLYKTHGKASFAKVKKALTEKTEREVWFKQESFILHIRCRSLRDAELILSCARKAGFKHSGIISTSRIIVEVVSNERIETPVKAGDKIFVSDENLRYLVRRANEKLLITRKKIALFFENLKRKK
ncbi:hypothetical protein D6745_04650 [Candidatus Woesearchaeota archaeon]|nr:MAG: hypothetical protein D6745_04650 [Candidatus Woesearchaeota archaeon]